MVRRLLDELYPCPMAKVAREMVEAFNALSRAVRDGILATSAFGFAVEESR